MDKTSWTSSTFDTGSEVRKKTSVMGSALSIKKNQYPDPDSS